MKTVIIHLSLLCLASIVLPKDLMADINSGQPSVFDKMSGVEVRDLRLTTDLTALLEPEMITDDYQPAQLSYEDDEGEVVEWSIGVKTRGRFRRRICDFAPLKLNFSKSDLRAAGLAEHDKLKLVTHCDDNRIVGQELLLREYLAYQLYQELTAASFRVQLVRIKYTDSSTGRSFRRYGMIIEDKDELAERLAAPECEECYNPAPELLDRQAENMHAMFQYFVGNTDYNVHMLRNIKLFERADGLLIPVGYDFDFSGVVRAHYAIPCNYLGQETIIDRVYLGFAAADPTFEASLQLFEEKKETFIDIVMDFRRLPRASRVEIRDYLMAFYEEIDAIQASASQEFYLNLKNGYLDVLPEGATPAPYQYVR